MALPTTQTADLIKTDGFKLAGITPTASQLAEADSWLRKCLNQFYKSKDFKLMEDEYEFTIITQQHHEHKREIR